jgi:hypothetical protein
MKFKQLLTITFILCLFALSGNAQKRFILENKGSVVNTRIFDNLDSAVAAIQTDDILYIPGGNFGLPSGIMTINKNSVTIIGAGHHPDSTNATERTYLVGDIRVNANSVHITGIYLTNSIHVFGVINNPIISGFSMSRCNVGSVRLEDDANGLPETQLSSINNSIIRTTLYGGNTFSAFISNNIIIQQVNYFDGSSVYFTNNTFIDGSVFSGYAINYIKGATFEKNIFRVSIGIVPPSIYSNSPDSTFDVDNLYFQDGNNNPVRSTNNTFNDNIFNWWSGNPSYVVYATGAGGNVFNNSRRLVSFQGGSSLPTSFDYTFNYRYNGGSQYGIYGSSGDNFKYIPRNPHIKSAIISEQTDNNGNLQILFEVEAKQ